MTRATSARLKKLETAAAEQQKRELRERWKRAHAKAASATQAEIDAVLDRAANWTDEKTPWLKAAADHELLICQTHQEAYLQRLAAAYPPEKTAALMERLDANRNSAESTAFLQSLSDIELAVIIGQPSGSEHDLDWDSVPEIALDAFIDGEISFDELRERYPAQEVTEHE